MTQDEIIRMARDAGLIQYVQIEKTCVSNALERFAALVAAHEREACAKVCKNLANSQFESGETETAGVLDHCAAAIRARSNSNDHN